MIDRPQNGLELLLFALQAVEKNIGLIVLENNELCGSCALPSHSWPQNKLTSDVKPLPSNAALT